MAVDAYRRIIEDEPNDAAALEALERLYFATEQWTDLLEIYRVQLNNIETSVDRLNKRFQMAQLLEFLSDPHAAIDLYLEVLEEESENTAALQSVGRLYAFEEMWAELADNLELRMTLASDETELLGFRLELAEVRELRLGEIESALEIYDDVLAVHPDNERVRRGLEQVVVRAKCA